MNSYTLKKGLMAGFSAFALMGSTAAQGDCDLSASAVVTQPTCGNSDGAINVTVIGGTFPFYYFWNDGPTVEDRTGLAAGFYEITIFDANDCGYKLPFELECEETEICQFRTQTMGGWGAPPSGNNPAMYLQNHFASCFPNGITVGCITGNTLTLTTSTAVKNFLPCSAMPAQLTQDWVNPGGSLNNTLAGQLVAATINVTVDACDSNFGQANSWIGDGIIVSGDFAGWTVQQLLDAANQFIGGCGGSYSASDLNEALTDFNENYLGGTTNNGFIECKKEEGEKSMILGNGKDALGAYPNPTTGEMTLSIVADGAVEISVIDLSGRTVISLGTLEVKSARQMNIDLGGLQDGSYFIAMTRDGNTTLERIVVAR